MIWWYIFYAFLGIHIFTTLFYAIYMYIYYYRSGFLFVINLFIGSYCFFKSLSQWI